MTKFDFKQWIIDNKAQNKRALNENYYEGDIDEIENKGWKKFKKKLNPKNWFEEIDEDDMMDEQSSPTTPICAPPMICHAFSRCNTGNQDDGNIQNFITSQWGDPQTFWADLGSPTNLGQHVKDQVSGTMFIYKGIQTHNTYNFGSTAPIGVNKCGCKPGCTNPNYVEYDPTATCNNGSCQTLIPDVFTECQNCCCRERGGAAFEEGVNPTINAVYQLMEQAARQRTGKIPTDLEPTPTNPVGRRKPTTKPDVKFAAPTSLDPYGPIGPEEPIGGCIDGTQYDPDVSTIIPDTGMCKCPNPGTVGILSYSNPNPGIPNNTGAPNGTGPCV